MSQPEFPRDPDEWGRADYALAAGAVLSLAVLLTGAIMGL